MNRCDKKVLDQRTSADIDMSLKNILHTVTVNANTLPVGTFKYKVFQYPSDIDIFEKLESCCTYNTARISTVNKIKSVIFKVLQNDQVIFTDFKAGYDTRYKIYTGLIKDNNIVDYDPLLIKRDVNNLYTSNLLTYEQYLDIYSHIDAVPQIERYIILNEKLRDLWVIRWSSDEILREYKILPGNYKLFLDVALSQGSIVKLDTIAYIDDRYVEVTNFFNIVQYDRYGDKTYFTEELKDYGSSLLSDVYKYYDFNILKSVKRLWMYLAFKNRFCDLGQFTELFSSDIAFESQLVGDVETAIVLLQSNFAYDKNLLL